MLRKTIPIFLLFYATALLGNNESLDSLLALKVINQDTQQIHNLMDIGKIYYLKGNNHLSKKYFSLADSLSTISNFTAGKVRSWRSLASLYSRNGSFDTAHLYIEKGLLLIDELDLNIVNKVDYLINKGVIFYFAGDIASALQPYIEAVQICRTHGFEEKRSMLLNNLGIFYRQLGRLDEAMKIYEESYDIRLSKNDSLGMANVLFNKASLFSHMNDELSSIKTVQEARTIFERINSKSDVLLCDLLLGTSYQTLEKYEISNKYLNTLKDIKDLPFDQEHKQLLYLTLSNNALSLNQPVKALGYLNHIENDIKNVPVGSNSAKLQLFKAKTFKALAKYKKSVVHYENYLELKEKEIEEDNQKLLKEMETKFLSEKKDYQIAILDSENKINSLKLQTANTRNWILLIGLTALVLVLTFLFRLYKKLSQKNWQISQANDDKEVLLKEIHHRVKNNLQVISALLSLQSRYLKDEGAIEAIQKGHDRVESMALIHKDLYQHDNLKGVNTKNYLERLVDNLFSSYNILEERVKLEFDIDTIWLDVDTMIPLGLMINELLSNALKHAFVDQENGVLSMSLKDHGGYLELIVADNGKGIKNFDTLASSSFGYSLVQSFARKLDADIQYENNNGLKMKLQIKDYKKVA